MYTLSKLNVGARLASVSRSTRITPLLSTQLHNSSISLTPSCWFSTSVPSTTSIPPVTSTPTEIKQTFPPDVSFYRRKLDPRLIHLNSRDGRKLFQEALDAETMELYFPMAENFITQSDPAYCSLTTLAMCLNAMNIDPGKVWKWPWRWFHEDVLCSCLNRAPVLTHGITFEQFLQLSQCHGLKTKSHFASLTTISEFRETVKALSTRSSVVTHGFASDSTRPPCTSIEHLPSPEPPNPLHSYVYKENNTNTVEYTDEHGNDLRGGLQACIAVSFCRKTLGQTGTGHMSPIGGYHEASDSVLILDVARFKYPPYWVKVEHLWDAMLPKDDITGKSRGWCVLEVGGTGTCNSQKINTEK